MTLRGGAFFGELRPRLAPPTAGVTAWAPFSAAAFGCTHLCRFAGGATHSSRGLRCDGAPGEAGGELLTRFGGVAVAVPSCHLVSLDTQGGGACFPRRRLRRVDGTIVTEASISCASLRALSGLFFASTAGEMLCGELLLWLALAAVLLELLGVLEAGTGGGGMSVHTLCCLAALGGCTRSGVSGRNTGGGGAKPLHFGAAPNEDVAGLLRLCAPEVPSSRPGIAGTGLPVGLRTWRRQGGEKPRCSRVSSSARGS